MSLKCVALSTVLLAASLVGCAANPPDSTQAGAPEAGAGSAGQSAAAAPAAAPAPAAPAAPAPRHLPEDGTVAEFEPQNTRLSDDTLALLAEVAPTLVQAPHLEVVGYCNRQDAPKNARQVALARALAVRSELLRLGVAAKNIRVKYVTTEARHAVTVQIR
ncbi:MAG: OmpA family protein [Curvibacter sp.]|nr:OmpA family protein [Curvibacter sp.]